MPNAVDRLFDQVLSEIADAGIENVPDWPGFPFDEDDYDVLDRPPELGESSLFPLSDELIGERTIDTLLGGRFPPVDVPPDERELVEGGIRRRGFDALAFYKSRRFVNQLPFPGRWGIFYLKSGLIYLAGEIAADYPGYRDPRRLAHQFLLAHEFFHYRCDLQTLMLEAVVKRNLYIPLRRALRGRRTQFVEEAMANKAAYEWAKTPSAGLREFAYDFMCLQPEAYARFTERRLELNGEWLSNTLELRPPGSLPRLDIAHWVDASPKDLLRPSLCPQYVVYPAKISNWLDPALVLPPVASIAESDEIQKRLSGKYRNLVSKWNGTKSKLLVDRTLRGLNFKPWPKDGKGAYSVKIDDGFRAHLRHQGQGNWLAYILGSHKELGHG
ncbi:hypothetical protein [Phaeovulum sp.]|uniref:hypothetical protein n=1 Tax=Phaeovulum sp. TaxID=2934796 RepID=UPI00356A6CBC